ncbi:replicative DNA helicase loader DnaI [Scopulibacillus darangshiensis]|uniref:Replicative DNA helicase loader DnaI n=1 Tax=Scopulibacillus darangshiensis TaxID=442528 RepID=A0A4R2PAW6_9BACL|nr:primosomal protein DnaI [Scopulibacillus darangshiensis]TCP32107.1 replicative DNA helicase loader DnaI [Scopulibacillus darangshiensis]
MESIKAAIRELAKGMPIDSVNQKLAESLMKDPRIQSFLKKHPDMNEDTFYKSIPKLYQYVTEHNNCEQCPGLNNCPNMLKGYQPDLIYDKQSIALTFKPCSLKRAEEQRKKQSGLVRSFYVPKDILQATFQSIDKSDPERYRALKAAGDFVKAYIDHPESANGLYFYGKFGVGKTYIMGALMNALAERKQVPSLMVYTPDFIRELKGAIQDHTLDEKLDYIKTAPVLILDDIGAETMTPWTRDELLGSILQYRMMEKLPTLYTSNYDYDELEEHLSYSQKSGTESLKAKRIMERIRHYTKLVTIEGTNRRTAGD